MDETPRSEIDLHGLSRREALRALTRGLHSARQRRLGRLRAITGRGFGNREQKPVLRTYLEEWLRGPEAQRQGVLGFERSCRGGALDIRLR